MEPTKIHAFKIRNIKNLHVFGRTSDYMKSLPLFWTASGFSVNTKSPELWAFMEGDYEFYEPWVSVWINGTMVSRFMIEKGKRWYCLFRGLNPEKIHNIALHKETQAMSGDEKHLLLVHALAVPENVEGESDDVFLPQDESKLRIEFIGDSITTGEGLSGGVDEMDWISGWMSLKDNYAVTTAKKLDADFHILSQSGWGVTSGWDNDRNCTLPTHYTKVCSLAFGKRNTSLGADSEWDFSSWKSDFIVVNLGTNDWGAFNSPAKLDTKTGAEWKYHLDENGKPFPEDLSVFKIGVANFVDSIRKNNPQSHIIWIYGMCSFDLGDDIKKTLDFYSQQHNDSKIHFVKLPSMGEADGDEKGSRGHPGPGTHKKVAQILIDKINSIRNS